MKEKYITVFGGCSWDSTFSEKDGFKTPEKEMSGGKGANQAVAIARAGYPVKMISIVGDDVQGRKIIENLRANNVDVSCVKIAKGTKSDASNILVSLDGANEIKRNRDAIDKFDTSLVDEFADVIKGSQCVVTQSKMPKEVYEYLVNFCSENAVQIVLTPCPSKDLKITDKANLELLKKVTYITANEEESLEISQQPTIEKALQKLPNLIATCGADGVYFYDKNEFKQISALKPKKVVDTTGAGDTLCGNFVAAILSGHTKEDAIKRGVKAATMKLEKFGAQAGMPTKEELELRKF